MLHKLIKYTEQALLGIAVLQMDGVHGDSGQSQHTSKSLGLRLNFKYFTDHIRNVFLVQRPVFERVRLYKRRKAEKLKRLRVRPFAENSQTAHTLQTLFRKVSTLSIEPVMLYLRHKYGAGWKEEKTNRTERGTAVFLQKHRVGRRKIGYIPIRKKLDPGYGCECACVTTSNSTNSDLYKRVTGSTWCKRARVARVPEWLKLYFLNNAQQISAARAV